MPVHQHCEWDICVRLLDPASSHRAPVRQAPGHIRAQSAVAFWIHVHSFRATVVYVLPGTAIGWHGCLWNFYWSVGPCRLGARWVLVLETP